MLPPVISPHAALSLATVRGPYDLSKAEWDALNSTVRGQLVLGVPLAWACFAQVVGNYSMTGGMDYATVHAKYGLDSFRVTQFGAMMRTQWGTCKRQIKAAFSTRTSPPTRQLSLGLEYVTRATYPHTT
ncbi:hypothetical protein FRC08_015688 [Ceratobasidium sp. 394]|nr:hypothetical protein FRC08_015688 [Ceratobasidium sp. 394]KAG9073795.1 hypothetical protein FS749_014682 [Ceratobasidium sp. UAMH 11750]